MAYDLELYYYLKRNLRICYKTSSNDETYIRCPICGDSRKDSNKARFYISNKPPYKFHCFNCESSGVVNRELLELLELQEEKGSIMKYINEQNYDYNKKNHFKKVLTPNILKKEYFTKSFLDFSYTKKFKNKVKYIENRLDVELNDYLINKFKIIVSISDFFKINKVNPNEVFPKDKNLHKDYMMNLFDEQYVGFLSMDRGVIIFRNIDKNCEKNKRFFNLTLFHDPDIEFKKMYGIGQRVDKELDKHKVVLTEGPFDILGVFLYMYNNGEDINDYIFISNGGKGYTGSADYLTNNSLLNNDYYIFSDKDVNIDFYKRIKRISPSFFNNKMTIYYNNEEKDFGISSDKISLSKPIILR